MNLSQQHIAIVADWLIDFGWAELVISHLLETFPEADIYTSVCFMDHPMLEGRKVYTSWLQNIPFFNRHHKLAGILRPWAFRNFDLSGYDVIICSSSAESKQVAMGNWRKKSDAPVMVYCHTPIRYYWSHFEEYKNMMEFGWLNPIAKCALNIFIWWLRKIDLEAAKKADYFIANSENTRERIKRYYDRESTVIYPGVDIEKIAESIHWWYAKNGESEGWKLFESQEKQYNEEQSERVFSPLGTFGTFSHESTETASSSDTFAIKSMEEKNYYISIWRCIPYKKFDLLVDAFNANGKNLILVTNTENRLYRELKEKSKSNITWKLKISQEEKNSLLAGAKWFLFPPEEDFGLVPIEAMTLGIPVIAYGKWWALETVVEWKTGIFFDKQDVASLQSGIEEFESTDFQKQVIIDHAKWFDKELFKQKIIDFISSRLQ